jgi:hypothetical protein
MIFNYGVYAILSVLSVTSSAFAALEAHDEVRNVYSPVVYPRGMMPQLQMPAASLDDFASSERTPAMVKRTLLGVRQTCDAGLGLCRSEFPFSTR